MQHQAVLSTSTISELLDMALEVGAMSVWEWDLRSGSLLQRASSAVDFGYSASAGPGNAQEWIEQLHPSDSAEALSQVHACLAGEKPRFELVLRVRDAAGHYRWVRVEGRVAERDEQGSPLRLLGVTQDVHRLRTIEETVRRNAELFGKIADSIVCTDMDGVVTYWNQGATELYGWKADEMLGRHISERFPAEARAEVGQLHAQLSAGEEFSAEFYDYRKDGSRVWVEARIARYGASNAPSGIMGFARDVTKRRLTQETLRRHASIFSQLQDIVVCLDFEQRVTYWNDAAERILGWRREEMLGKPIASRLPASVVEQVNRNLERVLSGHPELPAEWQDYRKDGSRVWVAWRNEALYDEAGRTIGITAVGTDVTARKQEEQERKALEMQLFHAQRMESLGILAGGIAHDFNNTLAVVLVFSELALTHESLDAELRESLEQIRRAGTRARDLVARILTFSRNDELQRSVVDLHALLRDHEQLIRATLPSTVDLRVEIGQCSRAMADANQLHQVLLNLSTNAAQAMADRGMLWIRLGEERSSERSVSSGMLSAGNYAVIEVMDSGSGMSPETQAHLFEPFFTTKPIGQGTGLGLATVVAIVRNHGGGIDVSSKPGQGACFRVYLPLVDGPLPEAAVPAPAPPSGVGQRILIVDDEESVALLTRTALQSLGYQADCVFSPELFLERFFQEPELWDLLVTDQTMPRLTGIEVAQQLRAAGHRVPIVITTGFSRQLTADAVRAIGNSALLRKPFDLDELARTVGQALAARTASTLAEGA